MMALVVAMNHQVSHVKLNIGGDAVFEIRVCGGLGYGWRFISSSWMGTVSCWIWGNFSDQRLSLVDKLCTIGRSSEEEK